MSKNKLDKHVRTTAQTHDPRIFDVKKMQDGLYGCFCIKTGRLVASGINLYDAKRRAGKRGWSENILVT